MYIWQWDIYIFGRFEEIIVSCALKDFYLCSKFDFKVVWVQFWALCYLFELTSFTAVDIFCSSFEKNPNS